MKKALHSLTSLVLAMAVLISFVCAGGAIPPLRSAAETPDYYVIDDCDDNSHFTAASRDNEEKKQGKASLRAVVTSTIDLNNSVTYKMDLPEDYGDWYLEMWFYVDRVASLRANESYLRIESAANSYYQWTMSKFQIKSGWNKIKVKLSTATVKEGSSDFTQFNRLRLSLTANRQATVRLDDICLLKTSAASDKTALQAAVTQAESFVTAGGSEESVARFESALSRAQSALNDEGASQREVDVAADMLIDSMNAFSFEAFTQADSTDYAYLDFSSMYYCMMDGFLVEGGDLTTFADKTTAQFNDRLLLNPAAKYVVEGSSDLRFTFTYYDGTTGGLELSYGSTTGEKMALAIAFEGSNRWKVATIRVKDAALARSINGYDLAIKATGGATVNIYRAEIKVITADDLAESEAPTFAPQTETNNIIGAGCIGYQMWFVANESKGGWVHWGTSVSENPKPGNGNLSFDVYPYVQDYLDNGATLYESQLGLLGDGSQSVLFNSHDKEIVETHFQWISEYGIDCMAIQRFGCGFQNKLSEEENHLCLVRDMAEKYNKTFYVMYDVTGQGGLSYDQLYTRITTDFVLNVEQANVSNSSAYAHADGKPVVCIWGIAGDPSWTDYPSGNTASRVIRWFQERGYFVIVGTPDNGFTESTGEYLEPFMLADMISPWTVGRYNYESCVSWIRNNAVRDFEFCETYDKEYQPVVFPGFSWTTMLHEGRPNDYPRHAGEFIWRQASEYKRLGASNIYLAMFDEYDEGTAYMKSATDYFEIPTAQYFVTNAADGKWLSNDYYLRTAQKVIQLIKGETTDTQLDIAHSQGPIYWRNSFEKRWTTYLNRGTEYTNLCNIDVCTTNSTVWDNVNAQIIRKVYNGATDYVSVENDTNKDQYGTSRDGTGVFRDVSGRFTKSGEWAFQFNGTASRSGAELVYNFAAVDIMVSAAGLTLDYSLYAVNDLGRNVYVDMLLDNNTQVSIVVPELTTARGKTGQWVDVSVELPSSLVGRRIKSIVVGYKGGAGEFDAYIDNVILQSTGSEKTMLETAVDTAAGLEIDSVELAAAITAGKSVLENVEATDKEYLSAMKAIDSVLREQEIIAVMLGDVNCDGKVNTTDARYILQYAAEKIDETDLEMGAADTDGNGKVNTTDARYILQLAAEKIDNLPAAK